MIHTKRFILRELTEADATPRYASWLSGQSARYIESAAATADLESLRRYIVDRSGRSDVLFLGIFEAEFGLHIGNIKYEPVDGTRGYAVMGILIGDEAFRGRGVAGEVIGASAEWLGRHRNVQSLYLGVDAANAAAIRAYEKSGWQRTADTEFLRRKSASQVLMRLAVGREGAP